MKYAGFYLTLTILLLCFTANAQKDTGYQAIALNTKNDTVYFKKIVDGKIFDTFFVLKNKGVGVKDTLFTGDGAIAYVFNGDNYRFRSNDSLVYQRGRALYRKDSLELRKYQDYKKQDSIHIAVGREYTRADSLKKLHGAYFINDRNLQVYQLEYDSSHKWRKDTLRLQKQLDRLKGDLERIKSDSMDRVRNMNKKEISMEVNFSKNGTVNIKNLSRKLVIKTFNEKKVRIVTTVYAEPGFETKDIDWEKVLNIGIDQSKSEITIRPAAPKTISASSSFSSSGSITMSYNNTSVAIGSGQNYSAKNWKSEVTIYIPASARLIIENKYNDVAILSDLTALDADLMNVNLKMLNADKAAIKLRYGSVNAGDIKEASLKLLNCKFNSGDINNLIVDSKYSTVTFKNSGVMDITSVSDQFTVAKAGTMTVNKSFGKLNIAEIRNSIDFTGSSADVNIMEINASAKSIKINNKYADVKLPVKLLHNYTVQFDGNYSKVFAPFEMEAGANVMRKNNTNFTKTVGNVKKDFTAFAVSCTSCSVDFR